MSRPFTAILFALLLLPKDVNSQVILGDPKAIVYAMDIRHQEKLLVAICNKTRLELWNYETRRLLKGWQLDSRGTAVALDSSSILVAKANGVVDVYGVSTLQLASSQRLTDDGLLLNVKTMSKNNFIVVDIKGGVYGSDSTPQGLRFSRLFATPEPVEHFDVLAQQDLIVTFHASGKIMTWSPAGTLISEQQFRHKNRLSVKSVPGKTRIYASHQDGMVWLFDKDAPREFSELNAFRTFRWPVALDCEGDLIAIGTTEGHIKVFTRFGTYKTRLNTVVNFVQILPDQLPDISVVVGTQDQGIKVLPASGMKME